MTFSAAFALGLFAQIGLFAHLIARLEPGFGAALAAVAISLVTLCAVLGRTLLGWLLGARDRRLAGAANLLMQAAGSLLLAFGEGQANTAMVFVAILMLTVVGGIAYLAVILIEQRVLHYLPRRAFSAT